MVTKTRTRHSPDFKVKVALEAIRGEMTMAELSARHGVHATVIAAWKRQAIEGMAASSSGKAEALEAASGAEVTKLHAKIGQLVVKRDFLASRVARMSVGERRGDVGADARDRRGLP